MDGAVVRFFAEKGFGFIAVSNGTEFFFHKSKIISGQAPEEGTLVTFDAIATEKGMAAENIRLRGRAFKHYEEHVGEILTFKANTPNQGSEAVLVSDYEITVEDQDRSRLGTSEGPVRHRKSHRTGQATDSACRLAARPGHAAGGHAGGHLHRQRHEELKLTRAGGMSSVLAPVRVACGRRQRMPWPPIRLPCNSCPPSQ